MTPELHEALQAIDPSTAFTWLHAAQHLAGPVRIGVVATDTALRDRAVLRLRTEHPAVHWEPLTLPADPEAVDLGTRTRSLGVHALIWVTPASQPWTDRDRTAYAAADAWPRPERTAIWVTEWALIARMADDPDAESAEVMGRVRDRLGDAGCVVDDAEVVTWVDGTTRGMSDLHVQRSQQVSAALIADAQARLDTQLGVIASQLADVESALKAEDAAQEHIRKQAQRAATLVLATVKRNTEALMVDLGAFLVALEQRLPEEVEAVGDLALAQRLLPHWLQAVVERWTRDRLARWRLQVNQDIEALPLDEGDLRSVALVTPYLHPGPVHLPDDWTTKLGTTATLGGATVLLVMGLWLPGIVAAGGGLLWSQLRPMRNVEAHTEALVRAGQQRLQRMHCESHAALSDQVERLDDTLRQLGDERAADFAQTRLTVRETLQAQAKDLAGRETLLHDQQAALTAITATRERPA